MPFFLIVIPYGIIPIKDSKGGKELKNNNRDFSEKSDRVKENVPDTVSATFISLFIIFLKIGAFTFGGGLAMLPLIKNELVDKRGWVTSEEFVDLVAVSMTAPGAIVINTAVNVGYRIKGIPGSLASVLGASLPSFTIIMVIATFFLQFQELPKIEAVFNGVRPAVAALIAAAIYKIGKPVFSNTKSMFFIFFYLAVSLILNLHPILVILMGGLSGLIFYRNDILNS